MSKITLPSVAGGYNLQLINQNFQTLASELNTKVLYRNNPIGESNVLETPVDANGKNIFNVNDVYATRVFIGGVEIGTGGGGGGIDPVNFLLKVNNLSDVASTTTARANLGLGNVDNTSDASKPVSSATASALLAKQDTLVSATNIKTVNGNSLLGSGDLVIAGGGGGSGTVTSVSVTAANGVNGSVATATTTPAITLTLGAITPTSVVASGTVAGSNLSGTNTGDETGARVASLLHAATAKTVLVDADEVNGTNSATSFSLIRTVWSDVWAYIKSKADTFYALIPLSQNSQSAAYTLVLADAGKHILHPAADTTARTFTIPANSSVAFPIGTGITFVNQNAAGVITIAITTDTMRFAGTGTTGSRTLAANGIATALKITSTEWIINGIGLS